MLLPLAPARVREDARTWCASRDSVARVFLICDLSGYALGLHARNLLLSPYRTGPLPRQRANRMRD